MQNFDWVAARSACSIGSVFEQMQADIAADVQAANLQRETGANYGYKVFNEHALTSVYLEGNRVHGKRVFFKQGEAGISIENEKGLMFQATLILTDSGQCRFLVDGTEKEFWQVRRMALEDLFFGAIFKAH
jgi:hypothetical protein